MKRRADKALFWALGKWSALFGVPGVGRVASLFTAAMAARLMAGYLRREAARLDAAADSVVGLDDGLARDLRLYAARHRDEARGLD